ncbi:hypothetical protein HYH02_009574 [Chlamydomonas schloesseri]|uniref:Uncharacterized protein n=1 Tax=Chlamydomonas schloesseri TaxID=2026947 RepID=A0A835TRR1_9CHLO|nr:hypothetical protein HYH02_009574 [Chlamydomonas schloesseri]|eukprot:KAG2443165.1 hypothetical protein HYH02_009574 [Chlamydomonas schloesseri]
MRHGNLILSTEGLDEDQDDEEEQNDDEEQGPGKLLFGFEEEVAGSESAGPVELVVARAPAEGEAAERARASTLRGLAAGLAGGYEAAMVIEVKASVNYEVNIWQALAAGLELAQSNLRNGTSSPAAPVRVLLTDACKWYFLGLQALGGNGTAGGASAAAAASAPASDTVAASGAAGATGSAAAGSGKQGAQSGFEFTLASKGTFRLFDCRYVQADVLSPVVDFAPQLVQAMYCLYSAMYPDEDINGLPAAVAEGNRQAQQAGAAWLHGRSKLLTKLASPESALKAERARAAAAEARAAAAEARVADAEKARADAEKARADAAEQRLEEMNAKLAAAAAGKAEPS